MWTPPSTNIWTSILYTLIASIVAIFVLQEIWDTLKSNYSIKRTKYVHEDSQKYQRIIQELTDTIAKTSHTPTLPMESSTHSLATHPPLESSQPPQFDDNEFQWMSSQLNQFLSPPPPTAFSVQPFNEAIDVTLRRKKQYKRGNLLTFHKCIPSLDHR
jgi:hypothetical protein